MTFLLLRFFDAHAWAMISSEKKESAPQRIQAWQQEPKHAQPIFHSGELRGTDETTSVFLEPAGHTENPQVIPGSYLQTPESLADYLVVKAADQNEVIALVKT